MSEKTPNREELGRIARAVYMGACEDNWEAIGDAISAHVLAWAVERVLHTDPDLSRLGRDAGVGAEKMRQEILAVLVPDGGRRTR